MQIVYENHNGFVSFDYEDVAWNAATGKISFTHYSGDRIVCSDTVDNIAAHKILGIIANGVTRGVPFLHIICRNNIVID